MKRAIVFIVLFSSSAYAQWRPEGIPVLDTTANHAARYPYMVSDGRGGCYVGWNDPRNGTDQDIFAQHLDRNGNALWQHNGMPVVRAPNQQQRSDIIADEMGGVFFTWADDRIPINTFIYAQHVDSSGTVSWETNGVMAAERPGLGCLATLGKDGGIILLWTQTYGVVTQRLDGLGQRQWGDSAIQQSHGEAFVSYWGLIGDGRGGAIISWIQGGLIYGQHIRSDGSLHWGQNGRMISDSTTDAGVLSIVSDMSGGAIVVWTLDAAFGVYAQRVDSNGALLWGKSGVHVGEGGTGTEGVATDGKGGVVVINYNRLNRIRPDGTRAWADGVEYTSVLGQTFLVSDGASGGVVVFTKGNNSLRDDIYAQRVDSSGAVRWQLGGVVVSNYLADKIHPVAAPDGRGGVIAAWDDLRSFPTLTIYAGRIDSGGSVVVPVKEGNFFFRPQVVTLHQNYPNPFNSSTRISYTLDRRTMVKLWIVDILGREVKSLVDVEQEEAGEKRVDWDGTNQKGLRVGSGVYFYRLTTRGGIQMRKMLLIQ